MNTKALAAVLLLSVLASTANAQDSCSVFVREAMHDVSLEDIKKAADEAQHNSDCRSSGSSKGMSFGASYAGVGLSFGSSKSSSSQSCAEDSSRAASDSASMKYARQVVRESYSAYIACKELESGQVSSSFEILPRSVVVSIRRMNDPVTFNGLTVVPSTALNCTRKNPDGGPPIDVSNTAPLQLADSQTLTVTCTRTDNDPGEEELYPAADLIVETSRKSGKITLESNRFPQATTTRDLLAKIEDLQKALDASETAHGIRIAALETFATDLSNLKSPDDFKVHINVENKDWWNGKCPDRHVSTGHVLTTRGTMGPVHFIRLKCAQLPVFPIKPAAGDTQQAKAT